MKNVVILLCFIALNSTVFSQSKKPLQLAKFGDNLESSLSSKEKGFINEVYGDYANELVYSNQQRLKSFKNILRNRVLINRYDDKDLSSLTVLSKIPLANSINPNLLRDDFFDERTFNPLKYNFGFFSNKTTTHYRVDNTSYVITILSQY